MPSSSEDEAIIKRLGTLILGRDPVATSSVDLDAGPNTTSTLYPKISGKLADLQFNIARHSALAPEVLTEPIPMVGTVKLHGTHADLLVLSNGDIVCQSRNRAVITPESDNLGFATFCSKRRPQILKLELRIRNRWRKLHPGAEIGDGLVILAGEWIGAGIQKGVAIAQLSKRFVLCSIQVAGVWEPIEQYANVEDAEAMILNVSRGGLYHLEYRYTDGGEAFLAEAKALTLAVAAACPFGEALGVEGGGEGIVWTPAPASRLPNIPEFWLKTKGEQFIAARRVPKASQEQTAGKDGLKTKAIVFAIEACTDERLEQGWQYLQEMGVQQSMKGMGTLLSWVTKDIEVEEKTEIEEMKLGKAWKGEVSNIAKPWYERRMMED
ncbi:hypothetical protein LTR85_009010 [Meristemomyces frigidus]|nr:hypothetical protein LTR85_009010 [Meristemomyces frigidus]